jgi:hypothetical protein
MEVHHFTLAHHSGGLKPRCLHYLTRKDIITTSNMALVFKMICNTLSAAVLEKPHYPASIVNLPTTFSF